MNKRTTTLGQLAELIGGKVQGDTQLPIRGAEVLGEVALGEITLIDHADRMKHLATTQASAVVLCEKIIAAGADISSISKPAIVVADVHAAFTAIVSHFRPQRERAAIGISPRALVSPTANCGKNVNVHAGVCIGDDCQIGDGTTILPGAQILAGCEIGCNVMIGPGVVLYENTII